MSETKRVFAVPGRLLTSMTRSRTGQAIQYVGYDLLTDASAPADHEIPRGNRYRIKLDGELVVADSYIRGALRDGDISETAPVAAKPARSDKSKEA
jgi:hypothetical protein